MEDKKTRMMEEEASDVKRAGDGGLARETGRRGLNWLRGRYKALERMAWWLVGLVGLEEWLILELFSWFHVYSHWCKPQRFGHCTGH